MCCYCKKGKMAVLIFFFGLECWVGQINPKEEVFLTVNWLSLSGVGRRVPNDRDWWFWGCWWVRLVLLLFSLSFHLPSRLLWNQQHWAHTPKRCFSSLFCSVIRSDCITEWNLAIFANQSETAPQGTPNSLSNGLTTSEKRVQLQPLWSSLTKYGFMHRLEEFFIYLSNYALCFVVDYTLWYMH